MQNQIRPLSPHLTIYRPQISSVLSILHRITGLALYAGTLLLVVWLATAAYRPAAYGELHDALASFFGKLCLIGWLLAFYYHLGNGIRHLFWDIGKGFTLPVMARSGWAVVILTVLLTWGTWTAAMIANGDNACSAAHSFTLCAK